MIETENNKTTAQQEKFKISRPRIFRKSVQAMTAKSPNPSTIANVKNLFLNGFDLKQLPLHLAVNI